MRIPAVLLCALSSVGPALAQPPDPGRAQYESRCSRCHGGDGNGGELGPSILARLPSRDDAELAELIREGLPRAGMPGFPMAEGDLRALMAFLRTLRPEEETAPVRTTVQTTDGGKIGRASCRERV